MAMANSTKYSQLSLLLSWDVASEPFLIQYHGHPLPINQHWLLRQNFRFSYNLWDLLVGTRESIQSLGFSANS